MSVSRRLRFEILRRDEHACRYCGAQAPAVALTVDHVVPVALGGSDEPSNLVTACSDCNTGKASVAPDSPIVDGVADDALRWAAALRLAAETQAQRAYERREFIDEIDRLWCLWGRGEGAARTLIERPADWEISVGNFFDLGLTLNEAEEAIQTTMPRRKLTADGAPWRYFCGVCWGVLRKRQDLAKQILTEDVL